MMKCQTVLWNNGKLITFQWGKYNNIGKLFISIETSFDNI